VCVCVCFLNSDIHLVLFCCLLNMSIGHLNYFSFVFFWQLMVFKRHMYTHLSKSILSSMDITKRKRKEKSKHESKNTRSVKIMIGFEITVVYVCICMQRERERLQWNEMYNVHLLEGDLPQRLSHHYHQWTDETKAVHLLLRLTIRK